MYIYISGFQRNLINKVIKKISVWFVHIFLVFFVLRLVFYHEYSILRLNFRQC